MCILKKVIVGPDPILAGLVCPIAGIVSGLIGASILSHRNTIEYALDKKEEELKELKRSNECGIKEIEEKQKKARPNRDAIFSKAPKTLQLQYRAAVKEYIEHVGYPEDAVQYGRKIDAIWQQMVNCF